MQDVYSVNNLLNTGDIILMAENEIQFQEIVDKIAIGSHKKGLNLKSRNTRVMLIIKKQCIPECNIMDGKWVTFETSECVHVFGYVCAQGLSNECNRVDGDYVAYFFLQAISM